MKNYKRFPIFLLAIFSFILWQGCTENSQQKGNIEFGMNTLAETALKSADLDHRAVVGALVSIVGEDGALVYDKHFLPFYNFGEAYVTEKLEIEEGHYQLSEFLLIDSMHNILWATPLEGSELAYLVNDPLPIAFSVVAGLTTHLYPEVVWVGNHDPGEFGYVTFNVQFVNHKKFCLSIEYYSDCFNWWYGDSDSLLSPAGDLMPYYPAMLMVFSNNQLLMETNLYPGYNEVMIPRGFRSYTLVVTDCWNEKCYAEVFDAETLKQFSCEYGELLFIHCESSQNNLIITPEDVTEPTIQQGLFGQLLYAYEDSIVYDDNQEYWPVVRDIYLYRIETVTDIYEFVESDGCVVYPMFERRPDLIVRSNSSGFFQAPMEPGVYLYMVKTEFGFYIDLYVSSRQAGFVKIEPEKVTELLIYIVPCYFPVEG